MRDSERDIDLREKNEKQREQDKAAKLAIDPNYKESKEEKSAARVQKLKPLTEDDQIELSRLEWPHEVKVAKPAAASADGGADALLEALKKNSKFLFK